MSGRVIVVGLGPAGPDLLTVGAQQVIQSAHVVRLRTSVHPAAALIDAPSYDHLYETLDSFEAVYQAIVDDLVALSAHGDVVYVVPGAPTVAEHTVELLVARDDVVVELLPAMSFLDLSWARLRIDPVERGVQLVDGHRFDDALPLLSGPVLVSQCHNTGVLNDIKLAFVGREPDSATVLHHLGLPDEVVALVPWSDIDSTVEADHLTSLYIDSVPPNTATAVVAFEALVRRLRSECPWDQAQTHESLMRYLIEESFEVVEAVETGQDDGVVASEFGDLFFQIVLHAVIADEVGGFDMVDITESIHNKLVRRHPHVFGHDSADDGPSRLRWEELKAAETSSASLFANLPDLPSLAKAAKLMDKGDAMGFRWPDTSFAAAKVDEELAELRAETHIDGQQRELGDVFLALVGWARSAGIDPDTALRGANRRFIDRLRQLEFNAASDQIALGDLGVEQLLDRWRVAKAAADAGAPLGSGDSTI